MTSRILKIEYVVGVDGKKTQTFKNPKYGLTKANAAAYVSQLRDASLLDPNKPGAAGDMIKAFYEETTITDLV